MIQRRGYSRTPLERRGQVNYNRPVRPYKPDEVTEMLPRLLRSADDRGRDTRRQREGIEPDCVFVITKRESLFNTQYIQSQPMTNSQANHYNRFAQQWPRFRVRLNVYLKIPR